MSGAGIPSIVRAEPATRRAGAGASGALGAASRLSTSLAITGTFGGGSGCQPSIVFAAPATRRRGAVGSGAGGSGSGAVSGKGGSGVVTAEALGAAAAASSSRLGSRAPHLLQNIASRLFEWPQAPQFFEAALIAAHCSKSGGAIVRASTRRISTCGTLPR